MTSDLLIKLERLPAPALLVGADNLIVFANWSAQELLLDIDVTDMPITGFLRDWKNYSAMEINPATMIVEVLLKTGQSMSMPAAFFTTNTVRNLYPESCLCRARDARSRPIGSVENPGCRSDLRIVANG